MPQACAEKTLRALVIRAVRDSESTSTLSNAAWMVPLLEIWIVAPPSECETLPPSPLEMVMPLYRGRSCC